MNKKIIPFQKEKKKKKVKTHLKMFCVMNIIIPLIKFFLLFLFLLGFVIYLFFPQNDTEV